MKRLNNNINNYKTIINSKFDLFINLNNQILNNIKK